MSGTPRSEAALRWSPARMPRPPEYCGSTSVMPNSAEKYAIASGASAPSDWYQRSASMYSCRSSTTSCRRRRNRRSFASVASRSAETSPIIRTGSPPHDCQRSGSRVSNRSRVSGCHDHRRFDTSWASGCSGSGRVARTVNRRRARTSREPIQAAHPVRGHGPPAGSRCEPAGSGGHGGPSTASGGGQEGPSSVQAMTGRPDLRLGITDVAPVVSCGSFSARAVVGEHVPITATVFREGHDAVAANVVWTSPDGTESPFLRMAKLPPEPDRWLATVVPDRQGRWTFRVEAWSDPLATWRHAVEVKVEAGQGAEELANDLEEGARLLDRVAKEADGDWSDRVAAAAASLRDATQELTVRIAPALAAGLQRYLHEHPVRELVTPGPEYEVWVDRREALYGSWYEFFPRSEGPVVGGKPTHGTFANAQDRLPAIADMGFDVVYLPPIHPIGTVNRKGPNTSQFPGGNPHEIGPDDVGSPWAIGSAEGGHDAVHPQLGTMADFRAFVDRTRELGMEVALDFALQAAPDHPWVQAHPEWFTTKPDGTIAYAENPPKKCQDIYPINFDNDPEGIYAECLRVIRVWIEA